jgi:hypothetical protein
LQEKSSKEFLQARLTFNKTTYSRGECADYDFDGTIIEVFAQMEEVQPRIFQLLLDCGSGLFDPSKVLLFYIGSHRDCDCGKHCPLERLLQLGADPNLKGYLLTSLQIAVVSRDFEGARRLLEAGADPNDTGDSNGITWENNTLMGQFNHLRNASPLHVNRNFECTWKAETQEEKRTEEDKHRIEAMLLDYGAEDFDESRV